MRGSSLFFGVLTMLASLALLTLLDAAIRKSRGRAVLERNALLVRQLGLTDLALFTEARYTRHISQADLSSAFQDHPLAMEHFPSGSIVGPPEHLRR